MVENEARQHAVEGARRIRQRGRRTFVEVDVLKAAQFLFGPSEDVRIRIEPDEFGIGMRLRREPEERSGAATHVQSALSHANSRGGEEASLEADLRQRQTDRDVVERRQDVVLERGDEIPFPW